MVRDTGIHEGFSLCFLNDLAFEDIIQRIAERSLGPWLDVLLCSRLGYSAASDPMLAAFQMFLCSFSLLFRKLATGGEDLRPLGRACVRPRAAGEGRSSSAVELYFIDRFEA